MAMMIINLIVLSLLAISLSCSAAASPPVYDTDGHELTSGASYYVLPAARGHGGGLAMSRHGVRCPLYVAQNADETSRGLPVRFTPLQQGSGARASSPTTVRVSSDVGIHFHVLTTCVQTTEWHVGDEHSGGRVVTGPIRAASPSGREKVFRVEKLGRVGYKLVPCVDKCQDLGVIRGGKGVWLGSSGQAHEVVFKKAPPGY
jgi:hypothetical protein